VSFLVFTQLFEWKLESWDCEILGLKQIQQSKMCPLDHAKEGFKNNTLIWKLVCIITQQK